MSTRESISGILLASAIVIFFASGCNEDVLPQEDVQNPFSIYGAVSPQLDTQSVRVYPVESLLTPQIPDLINDIRVTSTHFESGQSRTWERKVVTSSEDGPEFIFLSPFAAQYGARYRIEVTRLTDGSTSVVDIRVPELIDFEIADPRPQSVRIAFRGDRMSVFRPVIEYLVQVSEDYLPTRLYPISYEGQEIKVDGGWDLVVRLSHDREFVQSFYNLDVGTETGTNCDTLRLRLMTLDIVIGDDEWYPPEGVFDSNALVQVGTMSNVQNGFGFVGAGYRTRERIRLPKETVEAACFQYFE